MEREVHVYRSHNFGTPHSAVLFTVTTLSLTNIQLLVFSEFRVNYSLPIVHIHSSDVIQVGSYYDNRRIAQLLRASERSERASSY